MNFKPQTPNLKTTKNFKIQNVLKLVVCSCLVVCSWQFEVAAIASPEAKITQAIEACVYAKYPDWVGLRVEIELKYAKNLGTLLAGFTDKAKLEIVDTYKSFRPVGNVIFPIAVTEGNSAKKIFVRAKISVYEKVVVAAQGISRQEKISAEKITLEEKDVAMMPQQYFVKAASVLDKEAKTTIPKGSTIYEWMVKEIPIIRNGQAVTVVVKSAGLTVKTRGVALMDGYLGQEIKVKTPKSREPLEGILKSESLVEVTLK